MNVAQARELLTQGRKDGTYEPPVPEDDKKALSEATDLLDMAHTAWDQHVRGPEVEILLKMEAAWSENGDGPKDEPEPEKDEPKQEGQKPKRPRPQPKEPEPEPEPEKPQASDDTQEDLSQIEPWDGYDREKVSDIIAGVNAGAESYEEEDFLDLMRNVWEYEAAHKGRATVLNHLESVAKSLQEGGSPPPTPQDAEDQPEQKSEPEPEPQPEPEPEPEPEKEPEEEPKKGLRQQEKEKRQEERQERERHERQQHDELGGDEYDEMMRKIDEELDRERLHKPKRPQEEEIPELPWDWTKVSDKELQRLHGIFSALAYYKAYHAVLDERKELACKGAADEIHNALMISIGKIDENGKEKRVALLEAEIESDESVKKWRRRQRRHATFAASHKNERDSYGKIVEALSRHLTVRHEEWERAGNKRG